MSSHVQGLVSGVGRLVRHLRVGQRVGLGVYRGACGACIHCAHGENNLCALKELMFAGNACGAFAEFVRIRADFAIPIPDAIETEHAAPLMVLRWMRTHVRTRELARWSSA
jgi:uncharacterized zinc-type alcohol dehydrogenase-like protein